MTRPPPAAHATQLARVARRALWLKRLEPAAWLNLTSKVNRSPYVRVSSIARSASAPCPTGDFLGTSGATRRALFTHRRQLRPWPWPQSSAAPRRTTRPESRLRAYKPRPQPTHLRSPPPPAFPATAAAARRAPTKGCCRAAAATAPPGVGWHRAAARAMAPPGGGPPGKKPHAATSAAQSSATHRPGARRRSRTRRRSRRVTGSADQSEAAKRRDGEAGRRSPKGDDGEADEVVSW